MYTQTMSFHTNTTFRAMFSPLGTPLGRQKREIQTSRRQVPIPNAVMYHLCTIQ